MIINLHNKLLLMNHNNHLQLSIMKSVHTERDDTEN